MIKFNSFSIVNGQLMYRLADGLHRPTIALVGAEHMFFVEQIKKWEPGWL